jgi:NAD(P)-dependent dehydrogenase (short-subunit alcohol dehydrogenase family)
MSLDYGRQEGAMRLESKKAIITGAGGSFGRRTALTFAREGADLIVADIDFDAAKKTAIEAQTLGISALPIQTDVGNEDQVNDMVQKALESFQRVDILVNNAGIAQFEKIQELSLEVWDRLIRINLTGTFLCSKAVIDHMIERNYGKIINVASIAAQTGRHVGMAYSASKTGILGITRTLALQVAEYGINVNAIAPGPVLTPIFEVGSPEVVEKLTATIPFKRLGTPQDIANLILFLASDEAEWITGEVIAINGGAFMG